MSFKYISMEPYWHKLEFWNFLREPNENVVNLSELYFGRSLYEEIVYQPPNINPDNERYWESIKNGKRKATYRLREDWRDRLPSPDPMARKRLWLDPDVSDLSNPEDRLLWNPYLFMDCIAKYEPCYKPIILAVQEKRSTTLRSKVEKQVMACFRVSYLDKHMKFYRGKPEKTSDAFIRRSTRFFENYLERIAGCILNHYQAWTEDWIINIANSSVILELTSPAKLALPVQGYETGGDAERVCEKAPKVDNVIYGGYED